MTALLYKSSLGFLTRHPWQLALGLLGIALGVAMVLSIRLTQVSADRAFDDATRSIVGTATHRIIDVAGALAVDDFVALVEAWPQFEFSPMMTLAASAGLPDDSGRAGLTIVGTDPLARRPARAGGGAAANAVAQAAGRLIADPGTAVIGAGTAQRFDLTAGEPLALEIGGRPAALEIVGVAPPDAGLADGFVIVDIATAQDLAADYDRIDSAELVLDDVPAARIGALAGGLPAHLKLLDIGAENDAVKRMTQAFYTNLTALSLLALLVGMFLVHNTATFLVLQRRPLFGRLRALGVSQREIVGLVLFEAGLLGALAAAAGVALGWLLARTLLRLVSQTVNDFYYQADVAGVALTLPDLFVGLALGLVVTPLSALQPALAASRVPPRMTALRADQELGARRGARWLAASGLVVLAVAAAALALAPASLLAGFVIIALTLLGAAALMPGCLLAGAAVAGRLSTARSLLPERLGIRTLAMSHSRTGIAAAALMVATAAGIGIGVMVASFRDSVENWLDDALRADFYVGHVDRSERLSESLRTSLAALDGVAAVSSVFRERVRSAAGPVRVNAFELPPPARAGFELLEATATADLWDLLAGTDAVLVTEPFAYRNDLTAGDTITLQTSRGDRAFSVLGVYRDYASEQGSVAMSRSIYARYWPTSGYDGFGIYAATDDPRLEDAIAAATASTPQAVVSANRAIKTQSLAVFDRTFTITEVMRVLAVAIAVVGVLGALLAQQLERTRDYGVYRALGLTDGEIARTVFCQTGLLGMIAATAAVPVGLALAVLLIEVINVRSFGWTMGLTVHSADLVQSWGLAVGAALVAGAYPAWRAVRIPPAVALHEE